MNITAPSLAPSQTNADIHVVKESRVEDIYDYLHLADVYVHLPTKYPTYACDCAFAI